MDATDPILLLASAALVSILFTPLASRMIASAAERITTELSDEEHELSRIRRR